MEQLSFTTTSLPSWLFESTIYISILICLIFVIRAVTKRKLPVWWSYGLWLLLILRMLMPFGFDTPLNAFNYVPASLNNNTSMPFSMEHELQIPFWSENPDTVTAKDIVVIKPTAPDESNHGKISDKIRSHLSFDMMVLVLWASGVLFFGIYVFVKNLEFWKGVRKGRPIEDIAAVELLAQCMSVLVVRKDVSIIETDKVKSPAIFGYFKPRLLLPTGFLSTVEEDQLRCVLIHELGHVKRHDIGISWLVTVLQIIYWFNPLVWYAFYHLKADQEVACDAYVLSRMNQVQPTDYANTIVKLLERFVQNRQLPSLAGIIENRTQIDRRITMILNFKRSTRKMTFLSAIMFLVVGLVFFSCSSGLSSEKVADELRDSATIDADMKHYKSDEWNFAIDIPKHWNTLPPNFSNSPYEIVRFGSQRNGNHSLIVFRTHYDPDTSVREVSKATQKVHEDGGHGNFITFETTVRSKDVIVLEFDKVMGDKIWSSRQYFIAEGDSMYVLGFGTDDKEGKFELYDRVAKTFESLGLPEHLASPPAEMKRYESDDLNFAVDVPADWRMRPPVPSNSPAEVVRFISTKGGTHIMIVFRSHIGPRTSLKEQSSDVQKSLERGGFGNFISGETTIGPEKAVTLDFEKSVEVGLWSCRHYFIADGSTQYTLGFGTTDKDGKFELFDQMAKTFEIQYLGPVIGI